MSLPRSDYDPRRVCVNPFPFLDLHLGKYRRTAGVYLAGGLVSSFHFRFRWGPNMLIPSALRVVLAGELGIP